MRRTVTAVTVLALITMQAARAASPQDEPSKPDAVVVQTGEMPLYPNLARVAHIQGIVRLEVTTDGTGVTKVVASGANKLLLDAAEQNVRTWKFYKHPPQTFTVTFEYKLDKQEAFGLINPIVTLELPYRVEIRTKTAAIEGQSTQ